jgi:hypothetical protein
MVFFSIVSGDDYVNNTLSSFGALSTADLDRALASDEQLEPNHEVARMRTPVASEKAVWSSCLFSRFPPRKRRSRASI